MIRSILITVAAIATIGFSFSQKVKVKKDVIYVEGMEYMTFDRQMEGGNFIFTFYNMEGEEIIYADMDSYFDPSSVSESNPEGTVGFYHVKFEGINNSEFEMAVPVNMKKKMASTLYKAKVINKDQVDVDRALKLASRKGTPHTDRIRYMEEEKRRREEIELQNAKSRGTDVIIIEKENTRKPLININL